MPGGAVLPWVPARWPGHGSAFSPGLGGRGSLIVAALLQCLLLPQPEEARQRRLEGGVRGTAALLRFPLRFWQQNILPVVLRLTECISHGTGDQRGGLPT